MTTLEQAALVATVGAILAYPLVMRWLATRVHPSRLRLADLGNELMESPHLSDARKDDVREMLVDAFDWRVMVVVAINLPLAAFGLRRRLKAMSQDRIADPDTRQMWSEFSARFIQSIAAANPLVTVIVLVELMLFLVVLFPLGLIRRLNDLVVDIAARHGSNTHHHQGYGHA